jgi:hypothetical protein
MGKDAVNLNIDCFELKLKRSFDKDDKLDLVQIELIPVEKYHDTIELLTKYFSSTSELAGVEKIYRQGALVRPQFTGHKKKYEKPSIGLTVSVIFHDATRGIFRCRCLNVDELKKAYGYDDVVFEVQQGGLINNISWFLELSQLYPFFIVRVFKILYNSNISVLRSFLKKVYEKYDKALNEMLKHLKIPDKPTIGKELLHKDTYIVVYRCQRSFAAAVITPKIIRNMFTTGIDKLILSNTIAYLVTLNESIAYYYSIILNYLVYLVKEFKGTFILNQYGRPIDAIRSASLEWVGESWQIKVAELSKIVHEKAPPMILSELKLPKDLLIFELVDKGVDIDVKEKLGERVESILRILITAIPELREAFEIINSNVNKAMLREAIRKVAVIK